MLINTMKKTHQVLVDIYY